MILEDPVYCVEVLFMHMVAYVIVFYRMLHLQWPQVTGCMLNDRFVSSAKYKKYYSIIHMVLRMLTPGFLQCAAHLTL